MVGPVKATAVLLVMMVLAFMICVALIDSGERITAWIEGRRK